MTVQLRVDGRDVEVPDDGASLLEVLRDRLGLRTPKDGCSPQGQCGCCTVWVDGAPRVACVTPARRVAGRSVTTLDGLDPGERAAWADAFAARGASQCGFCTPGIIMRLSALQRRPGPRPAPGDVEDALLAHLCRCTGWRTIVEAAGLMATTNARDAAGPAIGCGPAAGRDLVAAERDLAAAAQRSALEGGVPQVVGPAVSMGAGGFADDTPPPDALVAVPDGRGGWAVGETLHEARERAGKVQGRRSTSPLVHPLEVPPGSWDLTLRTTWVEPAYLETDASWCEPGGRAASAVANGGAFGAKLASPAPDAARRLADELGRSVRVVLSREDVVRLGPKRPPIAAGVRADGTGVLRVVRTPGIEAAIHRVGPGLTVEEVRAPGPPTSLDVRAAGWAEAAILLSNLAPATGHTDDGPPWAAEVRSPLGATANAVIGADGAMRVEVACGPALDHVVLRSYCIGAAHMALGWVRSEGIAVDGDGTPLDLTIRSFGILRAKDMPDVEVVIAEDDDRLPVNGSDAVFAAVAAAAWRQDGFAPDWPTRRLGER